eukprot:CAMPEP_0183755712 /NCGR_PEP_ID=MMETSP0739-20130205/4467_1 /TAXON_ID=385413 /ORGANISM="Thalassiosira miniscula, Strain CCMP1093" /LENGTH=39 /DNA_ID= /DNA_START= /DNA_END= /DNA_ORIENTATION=
MDLALAGENLKSKWQCCTAFLPSSGPSIGLPNEHADVHI